MPVPGRGPVRPDLVARTGTRDRYCTQEPRAG